MMRDTEWKENNNAKNAIKDIDLIKFLNNVYILSAVQDYFMIKKKMNVLNVEKDA